MDMWSAEWLMKTGQAGAGPAVVDNRVLVIGLDSLYRDAMRGFEIGRLLPCARKVAGVLGKEPADVPIEGYYAETPMLTEYFRLMRALQVAPASAEARVKDLEEFKLLLEVTSSPLYGNPRRGEYLLPAGVDPLTEALNRLAPQWEVENLAKMAYQIAVEKDDFSLVGLAARTQDPVVIAATRESVVLYAALATFGIGAHEDPEYLWRVDDALAAAANRFVSEFNHFVPNGLPDVEAANAKPYFEAYKDADLLCRCVRIGVTPDGTSNYHWAVGVRKGETGTMELAVDAFWSKDIWTTESYREAQGVRRPTVFFGKDGVPDRYDY